MLDHVERKIIKPAKTPNRQRQQSGCFQVPILENQDGGSRNPQDEEQKSLKFNPARTGEIFHRKRVMVIAKRGAER